MYDGRRGREWTVSVMGRGERFRSWVRMLGGHDGRAGS